MISRALSFAVLSVLAATALTSVPASAKTPNSLVIANEDTGQVVFDDGKDDGFCTVKKVPNGYKRVFAGTASDGAPLFKTVVTFRNVVKCN